MSDLKRFNWGTLIEGSFTVFPPFIRHLKEQHVGHCYNTLKNSTNNKETNFSNNNEPPFNLFKLHFLYIHFRTHSCLKVKNYVTCYFLQFHFLDI